MNNNKFTLKQSIKLNNPKIPVEIINAPDTYQEILEVFKVYETNKVKFLKEFEYSRYDIDNKKLYIYN